jgi:plastocyanin
VRIVAMLCGIAVLAAGCSSGVGRPVSEIKVVPEADGVQRVKVVAHSFWFEPNRIVVKVGMPVEMKIKNGGPIIPHNFTCVAPQAGIQVDAGLGLFWDGETARFTPSTPGEYPFFCDKDGHSKKGMTGTIVVVP